MDTNECEQQALAADERRSTQIEMIHRLLFTVDYYQRARDTGTRKLIPIRGVMIEAQSEICVNLRPSAVRFFALFGLFCGDSVLFLS